VHLERVSGVIKNYDGEKLDRSISRHKADELKQWLLTYLTRNSFDWRGRSIPGWLEVENSEIDVIYGRLLQLGSEHRQDHLGVHPACSNKKVKFALRTGEIYSKQKAAFDQINAFP
jgi:hypothetical protein